MGRKRFSATSRSLTAYGSMTASYAISASLFDQPGLELRAMSVRCISFAVARVMNRRCSRLSLWLRASRRPISKERYSRVNAQ